jgi:hypothetical protein
MNLSSLSAADLKRLSQLLEKRDALKAQVDALNDQIDSFASGGKTAKGSAVAKAKSVVKGKRGKRGQLTESVLAALREAGASGLTIKDLAAKLGRDTGAIHTWFFNAKKAKRKDVKKIGEAQWQWVA